LAVSVKITTGNKIMFGDNGVATESCVFFASYAKLPKIEAFSVATTESNPYFLWMSFDNQIPLKMGHYCRK
jgi:hypothetical protein